MNPRKMVKKILKKTSKIGNENEDVAALDDLKLKINIYTKEDFVKLQ